MVPVTNLKERKRGLLTALIVVALLVSSAGAQSDPKSKDTDSTEKEAIQLSRTGTFEIHVQGADLRGVLQLLSTQGKKNIVARKEVTGKVTVDLYGVTFKEALEAVMESAGFVYREKGNFIYVYTPDQLAAIEASEKKKETRVFQLHYLTAADAQTLITPALSTDGTVAVSPASETGITTSDSSAGGNTLAGSDVVIVRDYEENIARIADILKDLDVRPEQVLIEATILRASLTENNDLGVDFNALAGIDFESLGSTTDGWTNIAAADDINYAGQRAAAFQNDVSSSVPDGGLTIGLITNNIAMFVRALESVTDTTVLANPKLLVLNKQRAEVMIGKRDGYITTTVTETVATQTVEFLETGTRLVVRPYIGRNGWIRMEIHPEDSDGGVDIEGNLALPNETTTETTQNVLVRDGHTIVIGGLFREKTVNGRSQIPVFGNIPYLGVLFRSTSDTTEREEVIILVTPHIVSRDPDEAVSERLKDDIERFRIGQRKGLRWWGVSRLAQTHLRWAREHLEEGDLSKALWNVDMALSLDPRLLEAIRLKERLTETTYWADEPRLSSAKYIVQDMVMQDLGLPLERIVPPKKPRDPKKVDPKVRRSLGIGDLYEDPVPLRIIPEQVKESEGEPAPEDKETDRPAKQGEQTGKQSDSSEGKE